MTNRAVFPPDAIDPIVNKLIYFWYERAIFEEGGRWKETPLLEAARTGDEAACFVLLEMMRSTNISRMLNARNVRNRNALHCAVAGSNIAIARLLLRCDKSSIMMNAVYIRGETPVHAAVRAGNVEMAQLLLSEINSSLIGSHMRDGDCRHMAHQLTDKTQSIVNIQNKQGEAPLHIASEGGSTPLYNRNFPSMDDVTEVVPAPTASSSWGCGLADNRFASPNIGAKYKTSFPSQGQRGQSMVEVLLRNGSNIHSQDRTGSTPLHRAAAEGQLEVVRLLIESGAKSELRDNSGCTPLIVAKLRGHKATACLIERLMESKSHETSNHAGKAL